MPSSSAMLSLLILTFVLLSVSADYVDKRADEMVPEFQKSVFKFLDRRPPVIHNRASRIDCMLALRSFELCRNLL